MMLLQGSASHLPLRDESVQCVVTSPPYWGLRQYAGEQGVAWADGTVHPLGLEPTPYLYVAHLVEVFREVRRVLRADGTLWLNLGDSYAGSWGAQGHRQSSTNDVSISRNQIANHPKIAKNTGTTAPGSGLKSKDLVGVPWMVAFALRSDGWYLRSDIIWAKPNPMPESVTDRPTKAHEYLFLMSKSERYFYDADAVREPVAESSIQRVSQNDGHPKFEFARQRREAGTTTTGDTLRADQLVPVGGRNKRTVWNIATHPYPGAHFATYPEALVEPCILAGSKAGDVVLDPFNGSGTTGRVAVRHGRSYVGLDISREYLVEQATKRIDNIQHVMEMPAALSAATPPRPLPRIPSLDVP